MLFTPGELARNIGGRVAKRRRQLGLTQAQAAVRAGISYRTWRRLETEGKASIDDLVRATLALRCEKDLEALFPELPARTMDQLLERASRAPGRRRVMPS